MNWDWFAFFCSIAGGLAGGLCTFFGVKLTIKNEEKNRRKDEMQRAIEKRPRLKIVSFKKIDGYKASKLDCEVLFLLFKSVQKNDWKLEFLYDEGFKNPNNLVCYDFVFKNVGETEIDCACVTSNDYKRASVFDLNNLDFFINHRVINYSVWIDKKRNIGKNEKISIRFCFIKGQGDSYFASTPISLFLQDINGRYWHQPLFFNENNIENSSYFLWKDFKNNTDENNGLDFFEEVLRKSQKSKIDLF